MRNVMACTAIYDGMTRRKQAGEAITGILHKRRRCDGGERSELEETRARAAALQVCRNELRHSTAQLRFYIA